MTDQKLVDELEKALRDEAYDGGFGYMGDEQFTAYVRTLAETAAEVFEKVLTPTDDERGWAEYRDATPGNNTPEQRRAFFAALGRSEVPEPSGDEREAVRLRAALEDVWSTIQRDVRVLANLDPAELGGIVARALESSRSEVPEPSADRGWSHPEAMYSPEIFMEIQGLLNEAQGSPMHALRLAVSRQMSEPQGEPSDAWIDRQASTIITERHGSDPTQGEPPDAAIRNHGGWDMELQSKSYPPD